MTTPTEGVKLEPVKHPTNDPTNPLHRLADDAIRMGRGAYPAKASDLAGIAEDINETLAIHAQAAKRIEELEAAARASEEHRNDLMDKLVSLRTAKSAAEARALKAERQRDEAVRALEHIAAMEPVVDQSTGYLDTAAQDTARSVLTSIREG